MNVSTSVSMPAELKERVKALALREERNFSEMCCLLVERGLDRRMEWVSEGEVEVPVERKWNSDNPVLEFSIGPSSSKPVFSEPPPGKKGKRVGMCVHRVPAGSFCKFGCDL